MYIGNTVTESVPEMTRSMQYSPKKARTRLQWHSRHSISKIYPGQKPQTSTYSPLTRQRGKKRHRKGTREERQCKYGAPTSEIVVVTTYASCNNSCRINFRTQSSVALKSSTYHCYCLHLISSPCRTLSMNSRTIVHYYKFFTTHDTS